MFVEFLQGDMDAGIESPVREMHGEREGQDEVSRSYENKDLRDFKKLKTPLFQNNSIHGELAGSTFGIHASRNDNQHLGQHNSLQQKYNSQLLLNHHLPFSKRVSLQQFQKQDADNQSPTLKDRYRSREGGIMGETHSYKMKKVQSPVKRNGQPGSVREQVGGPASS